MSWVNAEVNISDPVKWEQHILYQDSEFVFCEVRIEQT